MYGLGYVMAGTSQLASATSDETSSTRFDLDYHYRHIEDELFDEPSPARHFWMAHDLAKYLYQWVMNDMKLPSPGPLTHRAGVEYDWWVTTLAPVLHATSGTSGEGSTRRMVPWVNALYDINTTLREIDAQLELAARDGWEVVPGTRSETWTLEVIEWTRRVAKVAQAIEGGIADGNAQAVNEARRHAAEIGAGKDGLRLYNHTLNRMYKNVESTATDAGRAVKEALQDAADDLGEGLQGVAWMDIAKVAIPLTLGIVLLHKMR